MSDCEKEIEAIKVYLRTGVYSINEVRKKLGEPELPDPNADSLIALTEQNGGVYVGTTQRVDFNVAELLPKVFGDMGNRNQTRTQSSV